MVHILSLSSLDIQHKLLKPTKLSCCDTEDTICHTVYVNNVCALAFEFPRRQFSGKCACIDLKKAYDTIDRNLLCKRLSDIGVAGKIFSALKSLYVSVRSCVRVNSFNTDWFDVHCALRQGCILSPLLFNLFINDLAIHIKSLALGVEIDVENICLLLYADDIVLLAESSL